MTPWGSARIVCIAAACCLATTSPGRSASQGNLAGASKAAARISVTIPQPARVHIPSSLVIDTRLGSASFASGNACVQASSDSHYKITATSSEGGFSLRNPRDPARSIAYAVEWADAANAKFGAPLAYNKARDEPRIGRNSSSCGRAGGGNATLIVRLTDRAAGRASAKTYVGTLKLLIAPD